MKLAYFVHDLTDPAVTRRVRMLVAGGAQPIVIGFRRGDTAPGQVAGVEAIDLGRTFDGRMVHRMLKTALAALGARRWAALLRDVDVVMARTLEMLTVADVARRMSGSRPRLVYECLDIHRLMLGSGRKNRVLRSLERALLRSTDLLVVSSPAFLGAYFKPVQGVGGAIQVPTLLVENKVLELDGAPPAYTTAVGPPWRIGWLGAIRCRRSLDFLSALAARRPDLVEVRIHGRPAYSEFDDFQAQVQGASGVDYFGPYTPADLPQLYGDVHFSWSIDFMEEGLNSAWLLPNRIYECSRHGAVPLALAGVETGRFLARREFGVRLNDLSDLEGFLERLTPETYAALRSQVEAVPTDVLVADAAACRDLVDALAGAGSAIRRPAAA